MNIDDYVRTKNYGIRKINGFCSTLEEDFIDCNYNNFQKVLINKKDIIKSSPNIIDLIEVGDYVDGCYIQEIHSHKNGMLICLLDSDYECYSTIREEEIKTIVTKEQFESMEYKVGEDNESN